MRLSYQNYVFPLREAAEAVHLKSTRTIKKWYMEYSSVDDIDVLLVADRELKALEVEKKESRAPNYEETKELAVPLNDDLPSKEQSAILPSDIARASPRISSFIISSLTFGAAKTAWPTAEGENFCITSSPKASPVETKKANSPEVISP